MPRARHHRRRRTFALRRGGIDRGEGHARQADGEAFAPLPPLWLGEHKGYGTPNTRLPSEARRLQAHRRSFSPIERALRLIETGEDELPVTAVQSRPNRKSIRDAPGDRLGAGPEHGHWARPSSLKNVAPGYPSTVARTVATDTRLSSSAREA